jgi:hypothetical protein
MTAGSPVANSSSSTSNSLRTTGFRVCRFRRLALYVSAFGTSSDAMVGTVLSRTRWLAAGLLGPIWLKCVVVMLYGYDHITKCVDLPASRPTAGMLKDGVKGGALHL